MLTTSLFTIALPTVVLITTGVWTVQAATASPPSSLAFVSTAKRSPPSAPTIFSHPRAQSCSRHLTPGKHPFSFPSHRHTRLYATIDDSILQQSSTNEIIERLELNDQFERWRFMQKLFEGELPASDIENILLLTLHAYLQHGPTALSPDNKNDNGGNASPVLTEEQRSTVTEVIDKMLFLSDGIGDSRYLHMLVLPPVDYESIEIDIDDKMALNDKEDNTVDVDPNALSMLEGIEQLLPDPVEDEDAYKGAWDLVIDMYGRESVRVREEALQREKENLIPGDDVSSKCCAENLQWRTLCAVGRVLIHFDFLTKGVLKDGAFQ